MTQRSPALAAVAGCRILVIPEQETEEVGGLTGALEFETIQTLRDFVSGGGTLVVFLGYTFTGVYGGNLVDALLGTYVSTTEYYDLDPLALAPGATGTPFAAGPVAMQALSGTGGFLTSSLPQGARAIYVGTDVTGKEAAAVVVFPDDAGRIIAIGWDFYDGMPLGTQDGGWLDVLAAATRF